MEKMESIFKNYKARKEPLQHYASKEDVINACQQGRIFVLTASRVELSNAMTFLILTTFFMIIGIFFQNDPIVQESEGASIGYVFMVIGAIISLCGLSNLRIFLRSFLIVTPEGVGCRFRTKTAYISWMDVTSIQPIRVNIIGRGSRIEYNVKLLNNSKSSSFFPEVVLSYFISNEFPRNINEKDYLVLHILQIYWQLQHGSDFKSDGLKDPT